MHQPQDIDPVETQEWRDALASVMAFEGTGRAEFILSELIREAQKRGAAVPFSPNTPYVNTISPDVALPFGWIISLPELRSAAWRENIGCGYSQSLPQKVIVPAQAAPEFRRSADIAEPEQDHRVAAMCGLVFSLQRAYPMRNSHSQRQVLDLTADVYRGDSTS